MSKVMCIAMCIGVATSAYAQETALIVVSSDASMSQELLADVTEAISFRVAQKHRVRFIPKERFAGLLKYESATRHGPCFYTALRRHVSHACVFEALQTARVAQGIVFMIEPHGNQHMFDMHVIYADPGKKPMVFTSDYTVDVSNVEQLIGAAYIFAVGALEKPQPLKRIVRGQESAWAGRRTRRAIETSFFDEIAHDNAEALRWSAVSVGVATLAFTTAAIVLGMEADNLESEYQACVVAPCKPGIADALARDGEKATAATNVMIGLAGTFATVTSVLAVLAVLHEPEEATPSLTIMPAPNGAHMMVNVPF